jgi:hypothetical protein
VYKSSQIATIVEDKVKLLAVLERSKLLLKTPVVFLLGLAFPSEAMFLSVMFII